MTTPRGWGCFRPRSNSSRRHCLFINGGILTQRGCGHQPRVDWGKHDVVKLFVRSRQNRSEVERVFTEPSCVQVAGTGGSVQLTTFDPSSNTAETHHWFPNKAKGADVMFAQAGPKVDLNRIWVAGAAVVSAVATNMHLVNKR